MGSMVVRKTKQKLKDAAIRQGSTDPDELERKRRDISNVVIQLLASVSRQQQKRIALQNLKLSAEELEARADAIDARIEYLSTNAAILTALGSQIDCNTYREPLEEDGRTRLVRYGSGMSLQFIADEMQLMRRMLRWALENPGKPLPSDEELEKLIDKEEDERYERDNRK